MAAKLQTNLSPQVVRLLVHLGVVLAVFVVLLLLFVVPKFTAAADLERRINQVRGSIIEQQALLPAWARYTSRLERQAVEGLALPEAEGLPQVAVSGLPSRLSALAVEAGLEPLEMLIDPQSLTRDPGHILVQGVVAGDAAGLGRYCRSLGALPWMSKISKLEARAVQGGLEAFVQVWVRLADQGGEG